MKPSVFLIQKIKHIKHWFDLSLTRHHWIVIVSLSLLILIMMRLFHMNASPDSSGKDVTRYFNQAKVSDAAPRRFIVDRYGELLAGNTYTYDIFIDPQRFNSDDFQVFNTTFQWNASNQRLYQKLWKDKQKQNRRHIAYLTDTTAPDIDSLIANYSALQARDQLTTKSTTEKNELQQNESQQNKPPACTLKDINAYVRCRGVNIQGKIRRIYPLGETSASLVGLISGDGKGQTGLELQYDSFLRSDLVEERQERDARGRLVAIRVSEEQSPLKNTLLSNLLETTIDTKLQHIAYKHLKETIDRVQAHSGMVLIVSAKTAEILANATYPSFNPNTREGLTLESLRNSTFTDAAEPGSIIKPLVLAKLFMTDPSLKETDTLQVNYGQWLSGKTKDTMICDDGGCGNSPARYLTVREIITRSSNVGISQLTDRYLNPLELGRYLQELGFGIRTEVNAPGESEGSTINSLKRIDMLRASFGYGLQVTAAQLASAYQALANKGERITLTQHKTSPDQKVHNRIFSTKISNRILSILEAVVSNDGTAKLAQIPGYRIGGKTGTAQGWVPRKYDASTKKWIPGHYDKGQLRVLFVGIAPINDPDMVAVVLVESAASHQSGGRLAAPLFRDIMQEALLVRGILPDPNLTR